ARAQNAAEEARRETLLQAQRQAEETLRRAQGERSRLEQDKRQLENEKRGTEGIKKQGDSSQGVGAATPAPAPAPSAARYDGAYDGQLCNHPKKAHTPTCWPVTLNVHSGIVEGSWTRHAQNASTARGTIMAGGARDLTLAGWTREGAPNEAMLV